MVGGPSMVFTRIAVVDETFIRESTTSCKLIVGIDASQLYPYSMCQTMPTGLYTRWNNDTESQKITPRQNKRGSFSNMAPCNFQQTRPECKIESNVTTGRQKKIDCFSVDGIRNHCNTVFETKHCQEARPSLTDNEIMTRIKNRNKAKCAKEKSNRRDSK